MGEGGFRHRLFQCRARGCDRLTDEPPEGRKVRCERHTADGEDRGAA